MNRITERVVNEFVNLVKIDSLSLKEEKVFGYIKQRLHDLPVEVKFQEYSIPELDAHSGNLVVKLPANTNRKAVFFDAHLDTVEPGIGIKPVVDWKKNIIKSGGDTVLGSDDKAGAAAMIIAVEEIVKSKSKHGDVYFIFTSAEEIGLMGVRRLDFSGIKADFGFILDSHGKVGGVIVAAPLHYTYDIQVKGKASHAGIAPEVGISAIKIAARIVSALPQGKLNKNTVANVGMIDGGKATNIIPDECLIRGEFRSHNMEDILSIKSNIEAIVGRYKKSVPDIVLKIDEMYRGFRFDKKDDIIRLANKALKELGIKPRFERTGGGSNSNIYNENNIKSVTMSVGMSNVHSTDEYIEIDDLENAVRLILKIIEIV